MKKDVGTDSITNDLSLQKQFLLASVFKDSKKGQKIMCANIRTKRRTLRTFIFILQLGLLLLGALVLTENKRACAATNSKYELALKLFYGTTEEKYDREKSVRLLKEAMNDGSMEAQGFLSLYYYYRESTDKESDYAEARRLAKRPAEQGISYANYVLGESLQHGRGVEKDETLAKRHYQKAVEAFRREAAHDNAMAMYFLAWCYYDGAGVVKNVETAHEWRRKSAELGYAVSMNLIGNDYYFGEGVSKNINKAFEWYKKSAEIGLPAGMNNLGDCYYFGEGVNQDQKKAFEWYSKSAELGNSRGMYCVGICYENGEGVNQAFSKAFEWYKKSAELGHAGAMCCLGLLYREGKGVSQDWNKAYQWFEKSAAKENARGTAWYGVCYYDGDGVAQDCSKGVELFKKSIEIDPKVNGGVQLVLGKSYRDGIGCTRDLDVALSWFKQASELGVEEAQQEYERLKKIIESGGKMVLGDGEFNTNNSEFLGGIESILNSVE